MMMKPGYKILLYLTLILLSWVIVGLSSARMDKKKVAGLRPVILNEENNHFLRMDDVKQLVRDVQGRPIEECTRGEVSVAGIERSLKENPYVKYAEAYRELDGEVVVELELRRPIARVMYDNGGGFYLDKDFRKIDLSAQYSSNVVLVRGLPWEPLVPRDTVGTEALLGLREFLEFVDASEFLRSQISEIVVTPKGELTIYPEVGDVVVEFGKPEEIAEKFGKMELFYRKVLNRIGWEEYEAINLKYKDQIVATRAS